MDFVVIDVETANADLSSICQVGIASFRDGQLADKWESLVNPETHFSSANIAIHGINERHVKGAPNWPGVYPHVACRLSDTIVVSHTQFDRIALERACLRSNLPVYEYMWLDSAQVVRMAWPEFSRSGYGLSNLSSHFGIDYEAHDALEDARCAGLILLLAVEKTGVAAKEWLIRAGHYINHQSGSDGGTGHRWRAFPPPARRDGNPDGALFGEVVVFTGELSISRAEAADAVARVGCRVDGGVTKHTTMLVVGDHDTHGLPGYDKSAKERKAELLISRGQHILILDEEDFMLVIARTSASENE